jgi:hypothetical protein
LRLRIFVWNAIPMRRMIAILPDGRSQLFH